MSDLEKGINWTFHNWVPVVAIALFFIQIAVGIPLTFRTAKNVEAIAKCLIAAGALNPSEVQLSLNQNK